jgi:hypothetical protein
VGFVPVLIASERFSTPSRDLGTERAGLTDVTWFLRNPKDLEPDIKARDHKHREKARSDHSALSSTVVNAGTDPDFNGLGRP